MSTATISGQRQVTLPPDILNGLGLAPGDKISFEPLAHGICLISAANSGVVSKASSADAKAALRRQRIANLKSEILATPANLMESYLQETAAWEAPELADAVKTS